MSDERTVDEDLARKLAKKDGITPAAAVQKLRLMRKHATELKELESNATLSTEDGTLQPAWTPEAEAEYAAGVDAPKVRKKK